MFLYPARPEIVSINEGRCDNPDLLIVRTGEVFTLRCEVFGIPPPTVRWIFQNMTRSMTVPPSNMVGGNVVTSYLIDPSMVFTVIEGNYTCMANNSLGTVTHTLQVEEFCKSSFPQLLSAVLLCSLTLSLSFSFPVIPTVGSTYLDTVSRLQGETVVLVCPLPTNQVLWERQDGTPIPEDSFVCSNNQTLVLQNVTVAEHSDIYRCESEDTLYLGNIFVFVERE